jgi:hypothetical protein
MAHIRNCVLENKISLLIKCVSRASLRVLLNVCNAVHMVIDVKRACPKIGRNCVREGEYSCFLFEYYSSDVVTPSGDMFHPLCGRKSSCFFKVKAYSGGAHIVLEITH